MESLQHMLQDKYDWLTSTTGAKQVNVKLDANQLARIMSALETAPMANLPKSEPRMLGKHEPPGTRRSLKELAKLYDDMQTRIADSGFKRDWIA